MIRITRVRDDVGICTGCGNAYGIFFRVDMGGAEEKICMILCKACLGKFVKSGQEQLTIRRREAMAEKTEARNSGGENERYGGMVPGNIKKKKEESFTDEDVPIQPAGSDSRPRRKLINAF